MNRLTYLFFAIMFCLPSCGPGKTNSPVEEFKISSNNNVSFVAKHFLFDATKAEMAGNADWVIDEDGGLAKRSPTPLQQNINPETPETFWSGALSSWGIALAKLNQIVETLQENSSITYGSKTNRQDLSHYNVFIVDEPNTRFSNNEKNAIINFVKNGGGLFIITDHDHSDRNNDGWDSPAIWNDLMNNNPVKENPFGFFIYNTNISQESANVTEASNPITQGLLGKVTSLQFNNGTTFTLTSPAAKGLFWMNGFPQKNTRVMALYSTFGNGRVVAVGDSSPADDGTGNINDKLHKGWQSLNGNHEKFFMNASLWLAKLQ